MIILCILMILFYSFLFNYWFYKRMEDIKSFVTWLFQILRKESDGWTLLTNMISKSSTIFNIFPDRVKMSFWFEGSSNKSVCSASVYFSTLTYTQRELFCICGRDIPPQIVHCFTFPNSRISHSGASRKI